MKTNFSKHFKVLIIAGIMVGMFILVSMKYAIDDDNVYTNQGRNFPEKLSPVTPYDVDLTLEQSMLKQNKIDSAQRLFDILSWQMFISLNWPMKNDSTPANNINGAGQRTWDFWKESFEVFKEYGAKPTAFGSPTDFPSYIQFKGKENARVLFRTNKLAGFIAADSANELDQAFTSPIWDQNGNMVRYEIRMNRPIVKYLTENELYNIDGQVQFYKDGKSINFPSGTRKKEGVMEVKVAWKILKEGVDLPERYLTSKAWVYNPDATFSLKTVGMVGMHIATKTISSPQWIWATFEHVDNLQTNPLIAVHGHSILPSFYDPSCPTCPINKFPDTTVKPVKNQIQRVVPIPLSTQELNGAVQRLLSDNKSAMQYYQLIGTQWPTDPKSAPYPNPSKTYKLPDAVANKSGGKPTPLWLTNMVMETYFQGGTSITTPAGYNTYLGNEPAYYQIEGGTVNPANIDTINTHKLIFGTESCMGCHSSASIAIAIDTLANGKYTITYGMPRKADFEWLMQLKAQLKSNRIAHKHFNVHIN